MSSEEVDVAFPLPGSVEARSASRSSHDDSESSFSDESTISEETFPSSSSWSEDSSTGPLLFRSLRFYAERYYGWLRDSESDASTSDDEDDSLPPLESREETDWSSDESEGSLWCRPWYATENHSTEPEKSEADGRARDIMHTTLLLNQISLPDIAIQRILEFADANIREQVAASNWLYRGKDNDDTSYLIGNLSNQGRPLECFFRLSGLSIQVSSRGVAPPRERGIQTNLCTKIDLELRGQNGREDKPRVKLFQHVNVGRKWERMECVFDENGPEIRWLQQELEQSGSAAVDLLAVSIPGWKCKVRSATIHATWTPRALSILNVGVP